MVCLIRVSWAMRVSRGVCHCLDLPVYAKPPGAPVGSGYVREVGSKVTAARPGDPVLLSFSPCKACEQCRTDHPGHCVDFNPINFEVRSDDYLVAREASSPSTDMTIYGKFFGQSSLASSSIVNEASVINVSGLVQSRAELALYSPLGCGVQTGSGAIIQAAEAGKDDRVAVLGLGGVGLSAIMAAKLQGCSTIIGVDRFESRLELARALGATHVINTADMTSLGQLTSEVRKVTNGLGTTITLDSTGVPAMIREGLNLTGFKGKLIQVGVAPATATLEIPIFDFMVAGKQYMGVVQGDVQPQTYIPQLIRWVQEGKFSLDRFVKMYPAAEFELAMKEMQSGATVKPVIVW